MLLCVLTQKYNDFIDIASEVIAEQTREVNGKEVPMWTQEEVDEIVVAQVNFS